MGRSFAGDASTTSRTNMANTKRSEHTEKNRIVPKLKHFHEQGMVTVCKDICKDIKCRKGSSHYSKGHRYCPKCVAFFETKRIRCECCGSNLRLSGRN